MGDSILAWMTPNPVSVLSHAPVQTCAALMVLHRFRHLPVIGDDGRLEGLVDDASVFSRGDLGGGTWIPHDDRDAHLRVSDLTVPDVLAMGPNRSVASALDAMVQTGQDAVVVVDDQRRPLGILTGHDGLMHAATALPPNWTTYDLTTSKVVSVHLHQGVGAAIDTMRAHRLRHVVVLRGRIPVGVASWRALVEMDAAQRRGMPLDQALGPGPVETIRRGAPLTEVLERMVAQKIGCLPVVDPDGHLAGLISRSDILASAAVRLDP